MEIWGLFKPESGASIPIQGFWLRNARSTHRGPVKREVRPLKKDGFLPIDAQFGLKFKDLKPRAAFEIVALMIEKVSQFFSLPQLYRELDFEFTRSRGPGGQNVNKTNSACVLRWRFLESAAMSLETHGILLPKLFSRLTVEGELLIRSEKFRDQDANKKETLEKLFAILAQALEKPKPRKKTKPTRSSQRKRVDSKKRRSEIKSGRGKISY